MMLDPPTPFKIYNPIFTLKSKVNPNQDLPSFFSKDCSPYTCALSRYYSLLFLSIKIFS